MNKEEREYFKSCFAVILTILIVGLGLILGILLYML